MVWRTRILLTLVLGGLLTAQTPDATGTGVSELAEQIKAHLNERLYNTCKAVVLLRQSETVYTGHAEFLNGVKVDLEVTVSDQGIEYAFVEPESKSAEAQPAPTEIEQLQAIITQQQIEIARLRDLCRHAGIDAETIEADTVFVAILETDVSPEPAEPNAPGLVPADRTSAEEEPVWFTRPAYDNIHKGMTIAQVNKKLGGEGKLIGNSDFDRALNETLVWANPDDSHACVVFRNGKVLVKTQFGLPATTPLLPSPALETP